MNLCGWNIPRIFRRASPFAAVNATPRYLRFGVSPVNVTEGLFLGTRELGSGVLDGVGSVFAAPLLAARADGLSGQSNVDCCLARELLFAVANVD